jgi:hypothetical protein
MFGPSLMRITLYIGLCKRGLVKVLLVKKTKHYFIIIYFPMLHWKKDFNVALNSSELNSGNTHSLFCLVIDISQ